MKTAHQMHPSEIKIGQNEYKAYQLVELLSQQRLRLEQDRQWDICKMSQSVESVLLGLTMMPIYIDASNPQAWFVLDGRRLLQSLFCFFRGEFALRSLAFFPDCEGRYFQDLPFFLRSKLEEALFTVYAINQGVSERVRLSLVLRLVPASELGALSWAFMESLIDEGKRDMLDRYMREDGYDALATHVGLSSRYELILEYLRLGYMVGKEAGIDRKTPIAYVIWKLNEGSGVELSGWRLGLERLSLLFAGNMAGLRKRDVPVLLYYLGNRLGDIDIRHLGNNRAHFMDRWRDFYRGKATRLAWARMGSIYKELDKLMRYDYKYPDQ